MDPIEIREYVTSFGHNPFGLWIEEFYDTPTRARILARLDRLSKGNFGDVKYVGQGVFELRLFFGPGYRIYFGRVEQQVVLLLCGGDKDSQHKDISRAQGYWADFRSSK